MHSQHTGFNFGFSTVLLPISTLFTDPSSAMPPSRCIFVDMNIPMIAMIAKKGYSMPGAVTPTCCTSSVAASGEKAEAVQ